MSEPLDTPVEDTPNFEAMYETMKSNFDKVSGQYKSLQAKHNKTAKISKDEVSDSTTKFEELQTKFDALNEKTIKVEREALLSQMKPEIAEKYKEADVDTLKIALDVLGIKSGFPAHSKEEDKTTPRKIEGTVGTFDHATQTWK